MTTTAFNTAVQNHMLTVFTTSQGRRALFAINLRNQPSFYLQDRTLVARMQYGEELHLWSAESDNDATALFNEVCRALHRHNMRRTFLKSVLAVAVVTVLAGVVITGKSLFSAPGNDQTAYLQNQAFAQNRTFMQPQEMGASMPPSAPGMPVQPTTPQEKTASATPQSVSDSDRQAAEARLASNLKKAAERQLFTVPLSSGHERTLYIFADPNCPNCQNFEPLFEALSTHYNVEIFPTSAIGGENSVKLITPVLCLAPEQRKAAWKKLFSIGDGMLNLGKDNETAPTSSPQCDIAGKALAVNDVAFKNYQFPGTPWVISDDGRHVPQSVMRDPNEMIHFMGANQEK